MGNTAEVIPVQELRGRLPEEGDGTTRVQGTIPADAAGSDLTFLRSTDTNRNRRLDQNEIFSSFRILLINRAYAYINGQDPTPTTSIPMITPDGDVVSDSGRVSGSRDYTIENRTIFNREQFIESLVRSTGRTVEDITQQVDRAFPRGIAEVSVSELLNQDFIEDQMIQPIPGTNRLHVGPRMDL